MESCLEIQDDRVPRPILQLEEYNSKYELPCSYQQSPKTHPDWLFQQEQEQSGFSLCFDLNDYKTAPQNTAHSKEPTNLLPRAGIKIKQCHSSPFKDAKQISIMSEHKLWGCSIFISQMDKASLKYLSTAVVQSHMHTFTITTYLNEQKLVVLRIVIHNRSEAYDEQVWSYLSIYHQAIPNLDIYSLMFRWTQAEIYSFWLVRSIAFEAMLFRLPLHPIPHNNQPRHRYWHLSQPTDIKQANHQVLTQFAQAGKWIVHKPTYDYRLAAHNKVDWQHRSHNYNWNLDAHHLLQINTQKKNLYANQQLKDWFRIVARLYTDFLDCHRVQLITNPHNGCRWRDQIIFSPTRTYFNFKGTIEDWAQKPIPEEFTSYKNSSQMENTTFLRGYLSEQEDIMDDWLQEVNQLEKQNPSKTVLN